MQVENISAEINDFEPTLIDKRNITVRRKKTVNSRGVFVNQHPENDQLFLDKRMTCSRDRSNAEEYKREEKICILSDSIYKPINMNEFNRVLKKGSAIKRLYPGATSSRVKFYVGATLEEDRPHSMIILAGTNNITKKRNQNVIDIVHEILEIVQKYRNKGVSNVCVSGLICRPQYQTMINEINELLQFNAGLMNTYEYISNSNIGRFHLWSDNVHLNKDDTICLANIFWGILNRSSNLGDIS